MKDLPSRGFSELEVKNFGPIVEAKIDLRPLTVLVGPSNTGKSYLAILLYALHRFLSEGSLYGDPFLSSSGVFRRGGERKLSKREFDALSQWAEKAFGETELPKTGIALDPISDLIRSTFTESDEEVGQGSFRGKLEGVSESGMKSGTLSARKAETTCALFSESPFRMIRSLSCVAG